MNYHGGAELAAPLIIKLASVIKMPPKIQTKQSKSTVAAPPVKKRMRRKRARKPKTRVESCEAEYYQSLNNPWESPGACLPVWPSRPSMRVRSFSRGTISTNAGGNGFIVVNPWSMSSSSAGAATSTNLSILTNDVTGSTAVWAFSSGTDSTFATNTIGKPHNSFDGGGQVGTGAYQYRVVSSGIRIRFIGPLLNRGGRYTSLRVPGDGNFAYSADSNGDLTLASLATVREAYWGTIDNDWITVVYTPQERDSLDYLDGSVVPYAEASQLKLPTNNLYGNEAQCCLGIVISTTTASMPFEYEVTTNFELVGRNATSLSASPASPTAEPFKAARAVEEQQNRSMLSIVGEKASQVLTHPRTSEFVTGITSAMYSQYLRRMATMQYGDRLQRIEL